MSGASGAGAAPAGPSGAPPSYSAPYVKPHLQLKLDAARGRCVVAERGIPAGTTVMVTEPYAAVASSGHCAACFKAAADGAAHRCGGCQTVNYCSRTCQREHFEHHAKTCHGLRRVMSETGGHAAPPTVQLAVEVFMLLAEQRAARVDAARSGVDLRDLDEPLQAQLASGGAVLALEQHRESLDAPTMEGIAASALMMARVMQYKMLKREGETDADAAAAAAAKAGSLAGAAANAAAAAVLAGVVREDETEIDAVLRLSAEAMAAQKAAGTRGGPYRAPKRTDAEMLALSLFGERPPFSPPSAADAVEMFCRIRCNVFSLCDAELRATGIGVFPLASLLNHSCEPNCIATFRGKTQHIRTIRHVRADEELTLSYCDVGLPSPVRLELLREGYFFTCRCRRCAIYADNEEALYAPPPPLPASEAASLAALGGPGGVAAAGDSDAGGGGAPGAHMSPEEAATAAAITAAENERAQQHARFSALAANVSSGDLTGAGSSELNKDVAEAEDSYMKALLNVQLAETESLVKRLRSEAARLGSVIKEVLPPREEGGAEGAEGGAGAGAEGGGKEADGDDGGAGAAGGGKEGKEDDGAAALMASAGTVDGLPSVSSGGSELDKPPAAPPAPPAPVAAKDAEILAHAAAARAREAVAALSNALTSIGEAPPKAEGGAQGAGDGKAGEGPAASRDAPGLWVAPPRAEPRVVRHVPLSAFSTQDVQLLGVRCTRRSCRGVHVMMPPPPLPADASAAALATPAPEPASTCTQCTRPLAREDCLASTALQRRAAKLVALQKSGAKVSVVLSAGTPLLKEMGSRLTSVHYQVAAVANALVNASVGVRDWSAAMQNNEGAIAAFQFAYPPGHPLPALQQALQGKMLHFTYQPAFAVRFFRDALAVVLLSHGRDSDLYLEVSDLLQQAEAESLADPANLPAPIKSRGNAVDKTG